MKIIRSIVVAFSLYSRIPVPVFTWNDSDMKHAISALPLIGALIGILSFAAYRILLILDLPLFSIAIILSLLPVIITGGFHLDGFMDVQDAINSYQPKEKKLEIMKDPHIGAFAVISLGVYAGIYLSALYALFSKAGDAMDYGYCSIYMTSFFLVRALCGFTSVMFKKAKKSGMLSNETDSTGNADRLILFTESIIGMLMFMYFNLIAGAVCITSLILFSFFYKKKCDKEFGGITGDTAGFYVCSGELIVVVCLVVMKLFCLRM